MNLAHEDERRRLFEFPVAKLLEIKTDAIIGNHFHKLKDELFILCGGSGTITRDAVSEQMACGTMYKVPAMCRHSFFVTAGSILVCLATKTHDSTDDHI